ncbi:MAG: hypothetical protein SGPRY_012558 [Prymnesium sp.]
MPPSRSQLRAELLLHAPSAMRYVVALSWTRVLLPLLGGPALESMGELLYHKWRGPYLAFVWIYTALATRFCWWCYHKTRDERTELSEHASLADTIWSSLWSYSTSSLAWVALYMWMCALLGTLPTVNPLEAVLSAALCTMIGAAALLYGQRGTGPLAKALHESGEGDLKVLIFFTTWMIATIWIAAFTVCVNALGFSQVVGAWILAFCAVAVRYVRLYSPKTDQIASSSAELYPGSLEVGLTVGLVADAPSIRTKLLPASLGLGALSGAWIATVAVQTASSATWATWKLKPGLAAILSSLFYALVMSGACITLVANIRSSTALSKGPALSSEQLASETNALAVASGWAWFNALTWLLPPLTNASVFVRAYAAIFVTALAVISMLRMNENVSNSPTPPYSPIRKNFEPSAPEATTETSYQPPNSATSVDKPA